VVVGIVLRLGGLEEQIPVVQLQASWVGANAELPESMSVTCQNHQTSRAEARLSRIGGEVTNELSAPLPLRCGTI